MIRTASYSVDQFRAAERDRLLALAAAAGVLALLCALLLLAGLAVLAVALTGAIAGALLLWRWPAAGFFTVFGAAILLERSETVLGQPRTITSFWKSFDSFSPLPLPLTPAVIIAGGALGLLLLRCLWERRWPLLGRLGLACLVLTAALVYGLARGVVFYHPLLSSRFDLRAAISELNALPLLVMMYLLAVNLVRTRRQAGAVLWLLVGLLGLKALELSLSTLRLGATTFSYNEIAGHEVSLFISTLVLIAVGLWVCRAPRAQRLAVAALLPLVLIGLVANQRRTGYVALAAALVLCAVPLARAYGLPRRMLLAGVAAAVLLLGYGALAWNSTSPLAEPALALRSVVAPTTERDTLSNLWRRFENTNIETTIQREPLWGIGVGREYVFWIEPPPLDSTGATYWRFITHNAIYWLWMKFGVIGFTAFWYLLGSAIVLGLVVFRRLADPTLRTLTLAIIGVVVMEAVFNYGDGILNMGRNMAYLGALLGVLASLHRLSQPVVGAMGGGRRATGGDRWTR